MAVITSETAMEYLEQAVPKLDVQGTAELVIAVARQEATITKKDKKQKEESHDDSKD